MDIRKVKKLIDLLEESGIAEIEIKEGEESVRISRLPSGSIATQMTALLPPAPLPATTTPAPAAAPPPAAPPRKAEHVVTAPMVGTFYAAPSPGAKPFVEIGTEVKVGQVLCIIEAMKMMNEIHAEVGGQVVAALDRGGQEREPPPRQRCMP